MIINSINCFGLDKKQYFVLRQPLINGIKEQYLGSLQSEKIKLIQKEFNIDDDSFSEIAIKTFSIFYDLVNYNFPDSYYFTKTSLDISNKIKLNEEVLKLLKDKMEENFVYNIFLGDSFYRFKKINSIIYVFYVQNSHGNISFKADFFDLKRAKSYLLFFESDKYIIQFFRLLTYLLAGDIDIVFLKSNKENKKGNLVYRNNTKSEVKIVDSSWNKIIIKTEGFNVSGHLRLQPFGTKLRERKLIWINPFRKNGYIKKGNGI